MYVTRVVSLRTDIFLLQVNMEKLTGDWFFSSIHFSTVWFIGTSPKHRTVSSGPSLPGLTGRPPVDTSRCGYFPVSCDKIFNIIK